MVFQINEINFFILILFTSSPFLHAQPSTQGFISLDCGFPINQSYIDTTTNLTYTSDNEYISTGTSNKIASNFLNSLPQKQYQTLRKFPSGSRNCYTLQPVIQNQKYLIRAGFLYGNYDGLNSESISFDLHIGVNFWKTIEIVNASLQYTAEIITLVPADFVFVCLVNTGHGTPFISLLEMRQLKNSIYKFANASQSLNLYQRVYMGPSIVRFPSDQYDRIWNPHYSVSDWTTNSTTKTISNYNNDDFEVPSNALQFAATSANGAPQMNFSWGDGNLSTEYFSVFYFSELVNFTAVGGFRIFSIYYTNYTTPWADPFSPPYLIGFYLYVNGFFSGLAKHNFTLQATQSSKLPPIINAMEIYTRLVPTQIMTDVTDVGAMEGIKKYYGVKKNWMGDPCSPVEFTWDGLKCSYGSDSTKIINIDLSYSKLGGVISNSFASLQYVQFLDLSHNKLFGTIPDFLGNMTSLQVLNLTGNNFNGTIPDSLQKKINSGLLILIIDSNKSSTIQLTTRTTITIVVVPSFLLIVLILLVLWVIFRRKSPDGEILYATASMQPLRMESLSIQNNTGSIQNIGSNIQNINLDRETENLKFSYEELENLTNQFAREIGKGGFGVVYYGKLENGTEIAVKMSSNSSVQGKNEFFAEVNSLTKVHHKNLVLLIGYCTDGRHLALVFEYMPMGSFKDHLSGRTSIARVLTWRQRLQIAFEAGKGLDYLHTGCEIIHRDVKSSNILLGPNLEAKLSDFGLSKFSGQSEQGSYNSIGIVGTPGYIDPESSTNMKLTYKSDVYSFGVVLLEMLTGEPATSNSSEGFHIANRVANRLSRGNIDEIMDPKLEGQFNPKSAWKVVDLAMQCVAVSSVQRPRMDEVVLCLRECVDLEGFCVSTLSSNESSEKNRAGSSNVKKTVKFALSETER